MNYREFVEKYKSFFDFNLKSTTTKQELREILNNFCEKDFYNFKKILKDFNLDFLNKTNQYEKNGSIEKLLSDIDFSDVVDFDSINNKLLDKNLDNLKVKEEENMSLEMLLKQKEEYQNRLNANEILFENINEKLIDTTSQIILYNGLSVTYKDRYFIDTILDISEFAYLVDKDNIVTSMFLLYKNQTEKTKYYLISKKELMNINQNSSKMFFIHLKGKNQERFYKHQIEITIKDLQLNSNILCIDFGTSNTTAGCFISSSYLKQNDPLVTNGGIKLNDVNLISFENKIDQKIEFSHIVPTALYVSNCQNESEIEYLIGYSALNKIKNKNYIPQNKFFRSIKKWLANPNDNVEVFDETKKTTTTKKNILKTYIKYVINTAEHQLKCRFKNIHISYPVKLKELYIHSFKEILEPDYNIIDKDSIDEGFSVMYEKIKESAIDIPRKVIIIDCGGGTTDLSECEFSKTYNERRGSIDLKITSSSGDGDNSFGGDKITDRIFQYMKILFSFYYTKKNGIEKNVFTKEELEKETITIEELLGNFDDDIFDIVDKNRSVDKVYNRFMDKYQKCESTIPTNYELYNHESKIKKDKIMNNYYFLWELAEEMKKQFFLKTSIQRNRFIQDGDLLDEKDNSKVKIDADLNSIKLKEWMLSYYDSNMDLIIDKSKTFPDITFTIKEINQLIKGDIYNVVQKLLSRYYDNPEQNSLSSYKIIKLSGQSCRIDIFRDVLKEFVAGKTLRFNKKNEQKELSKELELKLSCVRGAILYFKDKKDGAISLDIKFVKDNIPFSITCNGKSIISKNDNISTAVGFIVRTSSTETIDLQLLNNDNIKESSSDNKEQRKIIKTISHSISIDNYKEVSINEIIEKYPRVEQGKILDPLENGDSVFVLYTDSEKYGFYIVNFKRESDIYYEGELNFYHFS